MVVACLNPGSGIPAGYPHGWIYPTSHVKATTLALISDQIAIVGLTSTASGSSGDVDAAYVIFPFLFS